MNKLWNEFVYGGHLRSLGAPALMYVTSVVTKLPADWPILVVGYTATESVHLLDRILGMQQDSATNQERVSLMNSARMVRLVLASLMASFSLALLITRGNRITVALSLCVLVAGLLYGIVFKRVGGKVTGFKSFFVAAEWMYVVFLLALYDNAAIGVSVIAMAIVAFVVAFVNTSVCDVKDIKSDRIFGIRTLASVLGVNCLILLMGATMMAMGVFVVAAVHLRWFFPSGWALLGIVPYAFIYMSLVSRGGGHRRSIGSTTYWPTPISCGRRFVWPPEVRSRTCLHDRKALS